MQSAMNPLRNLLDKAILRSDSLKESTSILLEKAEKGGKMPQGAFKKLAQKRILSEIQARDDQLKKLNIKKEEIFSAQFKATCKEPFINEHGELFLPPLRIELSEGCTAILLGKLEMLSSQGLIFYGKDELQDLIKVWPLFLIALQLPRFTQGALHLLKSGKRRTFSLSCPLEALRRYIAYYELSLQNVSPLMPEWSEALLQGSAQELEKAIYASSQCAVFPDPYLQWLFSRDPIPSASLLYHRWATTLKEVYEGL
jgi:exonuclease V gamma subunit